MSYLSSLNEYKPWMAIESDGIFIVVRDHYAAPFGPQIVHRMENGKPMKYGQVDTAWEVCHYLNQELYWQTDQFKRNEENWIQTFTGKKFHPTDPQIDQICIEDIAHALAFTNCRFGGHCETYYSVAQHCVLGSYYCEDRLDFLLHDSAEAYLCDIPRPVKKCFPMYEKMEEKILIAVADRFEIQYPLTKSVTDIDDRMLQTERLYLLENPLWKMEGVQPLDVLIESWTPAIAEAAFLNRFDKLTKSKARQQSA